MHAALGDPGRLAIVDALMLSDRTPGELCAHLGISTNLLAHHLRVLEAAGLLARRRSEGDGRRWYVRLCREALEPLSCGAGGHRPRPARVLFVCTGNTARSPVAAALWARSSTVPSASAGTHPARRTPPAALRGARELGVELGERRPLGLQEVLRRGDLVISLCDRAREELGDRSALHWSVPDPGRSGTRRAYAQAFAEIRRRVAELAGQVAGD